MALKTFKIQLIRELLQELAGTNDHMSGTLRPTATSAAIKFDDNMVCIEIVANNYSGIGSHELPDLRRTEIDRPEFSVGTPSPAVELQQNGRILLSDNGLVTIGFQCSQNA